MNDKRRQFLKLAAVTAAGLGVGLPAWAASGPAKVNKKPLPNALTAKRWAMIVDTRKFNTEEDFARVMEACHSIHNVPTVESEIEREQKQDVKWIWKDHYEHVFPTQYNPYMTAKVKDKEMLLLCNHCENPPCVRVCPTQATFKRDDGIVLMDFHRCIGCRYCMAGCPYGARSFNFMDPRRFLKDEEINMKFPTRTKGVVEKCNFCAERLAEGMMPACVEASNGALIFGDMDDSSSPVSEALKENFTMRRKPEIGTGPSVFYII